MKLRAEQEEILKYRGGKMGISAVPGSGKTFTLAMLAAELLAKNHVNIEEDQSILIVTYLNSSVDTFRTSIRQRLLDLELEPIGFDVRTLHSLALEIIRMVFGEDTDQEGPTVIQESQVVTFFERAVDGWIESNPEYWASFMYDDTPKVRIRWRETTEQMARAFVTSAKNHRFSPKVIWQRFNQQIVNDFDYQQVELPSTGADPLSEFVRSLLPMLVGIYQRYQAILNNLGALDFDDLIWRAADLLEERHDLNRSLSYRWPFILEDEAQDSLPLQELLLIILSAESGNWVRVGDPNQAITSTFTSADPGFLVQFIDRPDVQSLPLSVSGRCAPLIYSAANALVNWVCDSHPVAEVRQHAFKRQNINPTPPGDSQPNPPDSEASFNIRVYKHREEEELPKVAYAATSYATQKPGDTLAILVPTNEVGHRMAAELDSLGAPYDNLLRGSKRLQEIAAVLQAVLSVLADPLNNRNLVSVYSWLQDIEHPAVYHEGLKLDKIETILRSVHMPESFIYPTDEMRFRSSLPEGVADQEDLQSLEEFRQLLQRFFEIRPLAVDDLILSISDMLFHLDGSVERDVAESDLAFAYQIANVVRQWRDLQPQWRLPELTEQLSEIVHGRHYLRNAEADYGYDPEPGRISLSTQHSAKGREWDAVFLTGIDSRWIPNSLEATFQGTFEFLNGDPVAESTAALLGLMDRKTGVYPGRTATESARIDLISERLRLLYVGITRARKAVFISRSRQTRYYKKDYETSATNAMKIIYDRTRGYKA